MYHFCTITSGNYIPFVETLFRSLVKYHSEVTLHVLVTGSVIKLDGYTNGLKFYGISDIKATRNAVHIYEKYKEENDNLRWALKSVFLMYLLEEHEKVIYTDNDLFFFNDYAFLFELLEGHSLILTPHWCNYLPIGSEENFLMNYTLGLYNAGFVGASREGLKVLSWWSDACFYSMSKDVNNGYFVDQRYLDMAAIIDDKVSVVRHLGCNLGSWNIQQNKRVKQRSSILINNKYPIIFIHFNAETVKHISNGNDNLLKPYYEEYESTFRLTGLELDSFDKGCQQWIEKGLFKALKRKLLLRTRLKLLFFRISQKL